MRSNSIVIQKVADKAEKTFQSIGYPSKKNENWRMIDLSNILSTQFIESAKQTIDNTMVSDFLIEDCYHIYSINGFLDLKLSDKLPACIKLSKIKDSDINLEDRFAKISDYRSNGFNAKNTSHFLEVHKEMVNFWKKRASDVAPRLIDSAQSNS